MATRNSVGNRAEEAITALRDDKIVERNLPIEYFSICQISARFAKEGEDENGKK